MTEVKTIAPILIAYYSTHGSTQLLAEMIAQGVESQGVEAMLRQVPRVSDNLDSTSAAVPLSGPPYVTVDDLASCSGLALGSPTRFGNMAASVKYFLDQTSAQWLSGALIDKPACVFTSSSSMHGGQESTLLSMQIPLLHHGMVLCGLPYSQSELHTTQTGGTPYGVTHVALDGQTQLSASEKSLALAQGARLARLAIALQDIPNE
ncbi:NAD(P)H:quinone oxidoreductase [Glaciecola sp.]|jgi:NAD(P)H dehydrogenase (quinone)|nr:NAD(P)H:quinone oxidoreductase [Glaciecola sp.]